jgi:predicted KAP-like P-loop ATPase
MAKLLTGRVKDASKSDEFVRMPFAAAISNLLLNHDRNDLPVICGVFAPWGAGKSTFMRQMEKAVFAESNKNKAIWFEPWRYESSQDLAAALLLKLSSEIQKTGVDVEIRDAAKAVGLSVVKAFGRAAVKATDRMVGIPVVEAGIEGLKEFRKAEDEEQLGYQPNIDKTIKKFGEVVRDWVGDDSLVIFVDDLDRCLPDHMVRLLEGLHLYLSGIPCIAVVGIDRQAIEAAIRERYSGKIEEVGRHYIDKIFHTAFSLPRPSEDAESKKLRAIPKPVPARKGRR